MPEKRAFCIFAVLCNPDSVGFSEWACQSFCGFAQLAVSRFEARLKSFAMLCNPLVALLHNLFCSLSVVAAAQCPSLLSPLWPACPLALSILLLPPLPSALWHPRAAAVLICSVRLLCAVVVLVLCLAPLCTCRVNPRCMLSLRKGDDNLLCMSSLCRGRAQCSAARKLADLCGSELSTSRKLADLVDRNSAQSRSEI